MNEPYLEMKQHSWNCQSIELTASKPTDPSGLLVVATNINNNVNDCGHFRPPETMAKWSKYLRVVFPIYTTVYISIFFIITRHWLTVTRLQCFSCTEPWQPITHAVSTTAPVILVAYTDIANIGESRGDKSDFSNRVHIPNANNANPVSCNKKC